MTHHDTTSRDAWISFRWEMALLVCLLQKVHFPLLDRILGPDAKDLAWPDNCCGKEVYAHPMTKHAWQGGKIDSGTFLQDRR